ncbi:MAG TPA: tyrosine-type recombinase/integrase [Ktedonobacteraceae bacterium]|jgi:site-specific recombinase XerD
MTIDEAIEDYLACETNALTHRTYQWYSWALKAFEHWCRTHGITDLSQVTAALVQRFVAADPAMSSNTRHHKTQVVKGFLRWCSVDEETRIEEKTVRRILMPKVEQKPIDIFSEEDILCLLAACEKTRYCVRNRAILLLLLDIQLGELAGLSHAHAHRFRHTFAIQQLLARTPAFVLMEILGHRCLESTKLYMRALSQVHARQASVSMVDDMWSGPRTVREVFVREGIWRERQRKADVAQKHVPDIVIPEVVPKSSDDEPDVHAHWAVFFSTRQTRHPGPWLTTSKVAETVSDVLPE